MKNQKANSEIKVNDEFTVEFVKNNKPGGKPVCHVNGKVCFISSKDRERVNIESLWIVRVDKIEDKFLIVTPLVIYKTPGQNAELKMMALSKLPFVKQKTERKRKPKFKAAV